MKRGSTVLCLWGLGFFCGVGDAQLPHLVALLPQIVDLFDVVLDLQLMQIGFQHLRFFSLLLAQNLEL